MSLYVGNPIGIDTVEVDPAVVVSGVTRQNLTLNNTISAEANSGDIYPRYVSARGQKIVGSFSTFQLARTLDALSLLGRKISSDGSNPGVVFYQGKVDEDGKPLAGNNHRSYTLSKGLLVPRRITVNHQDDASLDVDALVTYDGTNNPVIMADSIALPSGGDDDQRFTIASAQIGGVALNDLQNLTVEFGISAETVGVNSDIWDKYVRITEIGPVITYSGFDIEAFKASGGIPLIGQKGIHTNSSVVLRKRDPCELDFVADTTAEHIRITFDGCAFVESAFESSGNANSETAARIFTRFDGTNAPIVIDTTHNIA